MKHKLIQDAFESIIICGEKKLILKSLLRLLLILTFPVKSSFDWDLAKKIVPYKNYLKKILWKQVREKALQYLPRTVETVNLFIKNCGKQRASRS